METLDQLQKYTIKERCDSCIAQAFYMISFDSGNLFFCRHHYMEHEDRLFDIATDIVDESDLLK